ncbi:MAG: transposase [Candidatus Edwardsbacteria bacterium]|nr:transposase [Candidatus Edwardsbacteria bacterium]
MTLTSFDAVIRTESSARKYLQHLCWENGRRFCPRCRSRKTTVQTRDSYQCHVCGYAFHDFSGRWLNKATLSCGQWLRIVKLYDLGVGPSRVAQEMGLSYHTVIRIYGIIRERMAEDCSLNNVGNEMVFDQVLRKLAEFAPRDARE